MSIDTRAGRAADGVRAAVRGVQPMAQITELEHTVKARRRNGAALGSLVAIVALAGTAWLVVDRIDQQDSAPPAEPTPSDSVPLVQPQGPVGSNMRPALRADVPAGWTADSDWTFIWLTTPDLPADAPGQVAPHVFVGTAVKVWDPAANRPASLPADYAQWVREHPWLERLSERTITVNGDQVTQIRYRWTRDAGQAGFAPYRMAKFSGINPGEPWGQGMPGEWGSVTILDVDGQTVLVETATAETAAANDALLAGANELLETMSW